MSRVGRAHAGNGGSDRSGAWCCSRRQKRTRLSISTNRPLSPLIPLAAQARPVEPTANKNTPRAHKPRLVVSSRRIGGIQLCRYHKQCTDASDTRYNPSRPVGRNVCRRRLQAIGDEVRQRPEPETRQDEGDGRRGHRLLDGFERVPLEGTRHRNVYPVPQRAPEELVGDHLWHGNPPVKIENWDVHRNYSKSNFPQHPRPRPHHSARIFHHAGTGNMRQYKNLGVVLTSSRSTQPCRTVARTRRTRRG